MKEVVSKCIQVAERHVRILENRLSVRNKLEVLGEVKSIHSGIGKRNHIEGVICSETEIITLYPGNVWENHCGLIPAPNNWETFESEVIRVLAHEMRHLWQLKNNTFYDDDAEEDADGFALKYIKNLNELL